MELFTGLPQQTIYTAVIENVTVGLLWECESYNRGDQIENMICSTHHAHAYMELFACHSGQVVISTENDALILHAGDAAIIPANIPHVKRRENTFADCSVIGIVIGRRYTRGCFNLFRILSGISQSQQILIFRDRPSLCSAVTSLTDHSDGNPALPALRLTLLLSEIAGELKEKDHRENTCTEQPSLRHNPPAGNSNIHPQIPVCCTQHFSSSQTVDTHRPSQNHRNTARRPDSRPAPTTRSDHTDLHYQT
jgi:mannose-6-phosphate isomerase-like protein (cupin superfamily)